MDLIEATDVWWTPGAEYALAQDVYGIEASGGEGGAALLSSGTICRVHLRQRDVPGAVLVEVGLLGPEASWWYVNEADLRLTEVG